MSLWLLMFSALCLCPLPLVLPPLTFSEAASLSSLNGTRTYSLSVARVVVDPEVVAPPPRSALPLSLVWSLPHAFPPKLVVWPNHLRARARRVGVGAHFTLFP